MYSYTVLCAYKIKITSLNMLIIITVAMWAPLETLVLVVHSQSGSHRGLILIVCCRIG